MSYRATKSGMAADSQRKIVSNFDEDEARKCLHWIQLVTGCEEIPASPDQIDASHDHFHELLKDGLVLCRLIDTLFPGKINWNDKTFQTPKIEAMRIMRERERIAMFTRLVQEYGVPDTYAFPTESLHEKQVANLSQVCVCIRALGIEAQSKPGFGGPDSYWPKKTEKQAREFTAEQMKAGQNIIGLQMGTNKGASQAGMNIGKSRHIVD